MGYLHFFGSCAPLVGDEFFWTPTWGGKTIGSEIYGIRGDVEMLKSLWEQD